MSVQAFSSSRTEGAGSSLLSQPSCWKIQLGFSLDSPLAGWKGGLIKQISGLCGLSFALLVSCGTAGYGKELILGKPEQKPCLALQGSASSMQIIGSSLRVQRDFPLCRNSKNSVCFCSPWEILIVLWKEKTLGKTKLCYLKESVFWKGRVYFFVEFNHFGEQPPSKHFFLLLFSLYLGCIFCSEKYCLNTC